MPMNMPRKAAKDRQTERRCPRCDQEMISITRFTGLEPPHTLWLCSGHEGCHTWWKDDEGDGLVRLLSLASEERDHALAP